jgi:hypothetical protein
MTWLKNSEFVWYEINIYCEKTKEEEIKDEVDEAKTVYEEKVTEAEIESKKEKRKNKKLAAVEHQWETCQQK